MSNPRPRWQIFIGYGDDGQVRYYFEDTDPDYAGAFSQIAIKAYPLDTTIE